MGWKYRKRITIAPGIRVNLSKTGASLTVGPRGASVNVGRKGAYLNMGLPGTGIYDRRKIKLPSSKPSSTLQRPTVGGHISAQRYSTEKPPTPIEYDIEKVESLHLLEIKNIINENAKQTLELMTERKKAEHEIVKLENKIRRLSFFLWKPIFGKLIKNTETEIEQIKADLEILQNDLENLRLDLEQTFENEELEKKFLEVQAAFEQLLRCKAVWDVVSLETEINRGIVTKTFDKRETSLRIEENSILNTDTPVYFFQNINGPDLYFYPMFLMLNEGDGKFHLIDYKDLKIEFSREEFTLSPNAIIHSDVNVVRKTWMYTNKNGSPDGRRSFNPQVSVVRYGMISFLTDSGMKERYVFSSEEATEKFYHIFSEFLEYIKQN